MVGDNLTAGSRRVEPIQVHKVLPEAKFNSVLLNRYTSGSDHVSWHSDNESLYGPSPVIASLSLGAEREFLVRRKKTCRMPAQRMGQDSAAITSEEPLKHAAVTHGKQENPGNSRKLGRLGLRELNSRMQAREPDQSEEEQRLIDHHHCEKNRSRSKDSPPRQQMLGPDRTYLGDKESEEAVLMDDSESKHSFMLKHGSLLVMRGYTQRDWEHSLPKRKKSKGPRLNLTFRRVFNK